MRMYGDVAVKYITYNVRVHSIQALDTLHCPMAIDHEQYFIRGQPPKGDFFIELGLFFMGTHLKFSRADGRVQAYDIIYLYIR